MDLLRGVLFGLHAIVSITLIVLVISQTARHEGLGVVGGSSGGPSRGRAGVDEQLASYTKWAAIVFMALSAVLFLCAEKFDWR